MRTLSLPHLAALVACLSALTGNALADEDEASQQLAQHLRRHYTARIRSITKRSKQAEEEIARLVHLEKLLDVAVHDQAIVGELEGRQNSWAELEDEIAAVRKGLAGLEKELEQLRIHYRVARDQDLGQQIDSLRAKVKLVDELDRPPDLYVDV